MTNRNLLHKTKLNEFKLWLISRGYTEEKTKSCYEVLRMRFDKSNVLIVYRKNDSKEHFTTHGLANDMVKIWIREIKRERTTKNTTD